MRIGPFEPSHGAGYCDGLVFIVLGGECVMRRNAYRREKQHGRRGAYGSIHRKHSSSAWAVSPFQQTLTRHARHIEKPVRYSISRMRKLTVLAAFVVCVGCGQGSDVAVPEYGY